MTYIPKRDNKAKNLSLLSIITGFVLMLLSAVMPYSVVFQVLAFVLIIVGVFLLQRYVLCEYRYIIDDKDDGSADLIVYKNQGKNDVKMCHISLLNVTDICKFGEKAERGTARYAYNQNLTDNKYVIRTVDGERAIEVIIEPDEAFLSRLRERIGGGGGTTSFAM